MRKLMTGFLLCISSFTYAQQNAQRTVDSTIRAKDSAVLEDSKMTDVDNIPVISLDDDAAAGSTQGVSSSFTKGFDPFNTAVNFNFISTGFRVRGYDRNNFTTYMNGIEMSDLGSGFATTTQWSGLSDIAHNRFVSLGMQANPYGFGNIGNTTNIDTRASNQRKQTSISYGRTNSLTKNLFSITHSTGMSKKGWAFTFSGSRRYSDQGYVEGTYINAWSFFAGVDKKLGKKHLLSFVVFGSPSERGGEKPATQESFGLANSHYYNPAWGYQNGKERNSDVIKTNQPVGILTHEFTISKNTSLLSAVSYSFGERSTSGIEFYNAAEPAPDYYTYLPSYYTSGNQPDSATANIVANFLRNNKAARQMNWQGFYTANRNDSTTVTDVDGIAGKSVTGRRSVYVLSERVTNTKKFNFNTTFNTKLSNGNTITGGLSYQFQKNNYFARIKDLLGGDFYVDVDQYAQQDFPGNADSSQNNVLDPNRILHAGDKWKYNYDINLNKALGWLQTNFHLKKLDLFFAIEASNTSFWRVGYYENGLYPSNSLGKSSVNDFTNYAAKAGATYKINKENYLYLNAAYLTKAPNFQYAYLSPEIKNTTQTNLTSQDIQSIEAGYVLNAPTVKVRLTGYYSTFKHGLDLIKYFDYSSNGYLDFALSNVNTVQFGGELGTEAKLAQGLTLKAVASVGRAYYDSRQFVTATYDNTNAPVANIPPGSLVYMQNYRVPNTPQEAYSLGLNYRSPNYWYVELTGNYVDQMWIQALPDRRVGGPDGPVHADAPGSPLRNSILNQEKFPGEFTLNFRGGCSWKLRKVVSIKKSFFLALSGGVNNILNNTNIVSYGQENGISGSTHFINTGVFPSRYEYAEGLNFSIRATLRFY